MLTFISGAGSPCTDTCSQVSRLQVLPLVPMAEGEYRGYGRGAGGIYLGANKDHQRGVIQWTQITTNTIS